MKSLALFVNFEKVAKFEIVCCKLMAALFGVRARFSNIYPLLFSPTIFVIIFLNHNALGKITNSDQTTPSVAG